jgi:putative DNA primase/helicase
MTKPYDVLKKVNQAMIQAKEMETDSLEVTNAQDIVPEPIEWLWNGWLAQGKLHLLAGLPGQGKTTIAMSFCSTVSGGGAWPDGSNCDPGNVLIWSAEDDLNDTLVPRLMAAGHRARCYFVKGVRNAGELRSFDPARDMQKIEQFAEKIGGLKLLVLDPIVTVVSGDSHNNSDVRRALQPLVDFGIRQKSAILGLTHVSKGSSGPALRVIGSIGFTAVARTVLIAQKVRNSNGTERGVFTKTKANTSPSMGAYSYSIEPVVVEGNIETSRIAWGNFLEGSATELLSEASEAQQDSVENELSAMLREELETGPKPVKVVFQSLGSNGYSTNQIKRASAILGVMKEKQGMAGGWTWRLPKND